VVELADHLQVLEAGQVLVDRRVLAGEADLRAQRGRVALHVHAGDASGASVRLEQRCQDPYRGCLPRTVWAEQAQDRSRRRGEVDPAEGTDRAVGLLEPFDDDRIIIHSLEATDRRCREWSGCPHL
jgi:hypothetical protein